MLAHLETLVKEHCLGCTAEHTSTTVNYLKAKTEALALKLRCLELEVLNATYARVRGKLCESQSRGLSLKEIQHTLARAVN